MSLFNVPEETIRQSAAEIYIVEFRWEIINAMFPIGALIGAASCGALSDRFGRRDVIFLVSIINIVASAITASSFFFAQLLMGRLITGIAAGMATAITSTYLNEISPEHLRGTYQNTLLLLCFFRLQSVLLKFQKNSKTFSFSFDQEYWVPHCN